MWSSTMQALSTQAEIQQELQHAVRAQPLVFLLPLTCGQSNKLPYTGHKQQEACQLQAPGRERQAWDVCHYLKDWGS